MLDRKVLKENARAGIKNCWFQMFFASLIASVVSIIATVTIVGGLLAIPFMIGTYKIADDAYKKGKIDVQDIIYGFKDLNRAAGFAGVVFLSAIYTFLWTLLFIIPGIVKGISYSAAPFIYLSDPNCGIKEAIERSKVMMDGHKSEVFVLGLSFIPQILLVAITLGIYSIYAVPYMQTTFVAYYTELLAYNKMPNDFDVPFEDNNTI